MEDLHLAGSTFSDNYLSNRPFRLFGGKIIIDRVSAAYGISAEIIMGPCCRRVVIRARFAACYAIKDELGWSFPRIARLMGGRDHTSILHACRRYEAALEGDRSLYPNGPLFIPREVA